MTHVLGRLVLLHGVSAASVSGVCKCALVNRALHLPIMQQSRHSIARIEALRSDSGKLNNLPGDRAADRRESANLK